MGNKKRSTKPQAINFKEKIASGLVDLIVGLILLIVDRLFK